MVVRQAELSDARQIAEVHVSAWQSAYGGLLPETFLDSLSVEKSELAWTAHLAAPSGQLLVFERKGRVRGFAACGASRDDDVNERIAGEIRAIFVNPREWKRRHGSAFIGCKTP